MDFDAYFSPWDYTISGAMLLISALIGVYFAYFAKQKQNSTVEYLMGGKTLGVFPVSMSLIASHISGIALMGLPAEVYTYGTLIVWLLLAELLAYTFAAVMVIPVLYNLNLTSSYEYLELRFNKTLRKLGSALFLIGTMLYVPIVIYVPALAFSQTTGISISILIPLACAVCTFYTSLGGLKAVVWTDTFQTIIMIGGVFMVTILGTIETGGIEQVWKINEETGRIEFINMTWDVTVRHTTWALILSHFLNNLGICAVNQSMVQRYIALSSLKKAQLAIYLLTVGVMLIVFISCYNGLVIFASFFNCDPVSIGYVRKPDGILPYYVMKVTQNIPAMPGLFMAGIFSAALSSMSTCQNSMCGVLFEDFIRPHLKKSISDARCSFYMKVVVVVIGVLTTILAGVVDKLGGIVQTGASIASITMGTLLGIFLLGMFVPWTNSTGALSGGTVGSIIVSWITLGTQYAISKGQIINPTKPFSIDGCDNNTLAYFEMLNKNHTQPDEVLDEPFILYKLSYLFYAPIGVIITMIVGFLVSWATGFQKVSKLDGKLLNPHIRRFFHTKDKRKRQQRRNGKVPSDAIEQMSFIVSDS